MTAAQTLDLAPAAIVARVADRIDTYGKADGDYITSDHVTLDAVAPVCVLGGIAVETGFPAATWETDAADLPEFEPARDAADLLIDRLALDPDDSYDETIGHWSDARTADQVVTELRTIAQAVADHG